VTISALDGLGGVGKSALAVRIAHQVSALFPDGQLFVDLRGATIGLEPLAPLAAIGQLLRSVDVADQQIPGSLAEGTALLRDRLRGTRTLILLDNASTGDQVRPLMPDVPGCLVLITSRGTLAGLANVHTLSLDVLPDDAARDLLCAAAGPGGVRRDDPALGELAELCGRMPLAIRIVAAKLRHDPALTVEALVKHLGEERSRLAQLRDDDRVLTDVLESSYAALPAARQRALRLLGLVPGTDFDAYAAAALFDLEFGEADGLLRALAEDSLLLEPMPGRYRFHDLVRLYARELAERDEPAADRRAALERLLYWYLASARSAALAAHPIWPDVPMPPRVGSVEALPAPDAQHASTWYDREYANVLAAVNSAAEHEEFLAYGWLLPAALWPFLELRGRPDDRLAVAETGLRCATRLGDPAGRMRMLRDKGTALYASRRYSESIEIGHQVLDLTRRAGTRVEEAKQLSNLAVAYVMSGKRDEAIEHSRQALELFEMLGEEKYLIPARINLVGALRLD
jgi:tetratricopeptide (TPR) repeat protein